ncbi:hypothetical protein [Nostoc sp.]|uniref:hypothetical protein n=1 Tax=Nostoc sp. TaxID=1180 RepID=UPI002FF986FF
MKNITLQINLSPGDINYAEITVPYLIDAHRQNVDEKIAIVDCCRPQRTQVIDPDSRFPEPEFSYRVQKICVIAEKLKAQGYLDRIVYLYPDSSLLQTIYRKYTSNLVNVTHDCWGCALAAYLAAFEVINTRYILHYDADMLLYQSTNYDWSVEAKLKMEKYEQAIAASPRVSPPFSQKTGLLDSPSLHKGDIPAVSDDGFWRVRWFSNRCFLMDKQKLLNYLPLLQGRFFIETMIRKYLNRSYPPSPEIMIFQRLREAGCWRLDLKTEQAWLLHPIDKSQRYIGLIPKMQKTISLGQFPISQGGWENIKLDDWEDFLNKTK